MTEALYMIQLSVDASKLYAFISRHHGRAKMLDHGYAMHSLLASVFDHGCEAGDRAAPKPFRVLPKRGASVEVLGYSRLDAMQLRQRAALFGQPQACEVCDLEALASKRMPQTYREGSTLGFFVQACPTRRVLKKDNDKESKVEIDAFLAAVRKLPYQQQRLSREQIYIDWLREQFEKDGVAKLLEAKIDSFRLLRQYRRAAIERKDRQCSQAPDVGFTGVLRVQNSDGFSRCVARGVGRHRAFGFGMLLLRPAAMG